MIQSISRYLSLLVAKSGDDAPRHAQVLWARWQHEALILIENARPLWAQTHLRRGAVEIFGILYNSTQRNCILCQSPLVGLTHKEAHCCLSRDCPFYGISAHGIELCDSCGQGWDSERRICRNGSCPKSIG